MMLLELWKILIFLLTLSVLIVLHEFGHFLLARRNGVRVNEFAMGFGPKLLKWKSPRSGTVYALNLFPIGGYCAMKGEDGKSSEAEQQREYREHRTYDPDNFQAKTPWQRLAIIVAGPFANFLLAFFILLFATIVFGVTTQDAPRPIVAQLLDGLPAQQAGVHAGDRVVSVNGKELTGNQLLDKIHGSLGKKLSFIFERPDGTRSSLTLRAVACPGNKRLGCIGFYPLPRVVHVSLPVAILDSVYGMGNLWQGTVGGLLSVIMHPRENAGSLSSIVGIGQEATVFEGFGAAIYLNLAAMISFALGIFNLLPIPALDGGRGAFIIAEVIRGKPVDPEKEALVHFAGFAVLILMMLVVTYHDIARIVSGHGAF